LMIEVGKDFRVSAQTKGLDIRVDTDVLDLIGTKEIDEEWVRHALMNVVDDAVKYTASRSGGTICLFGEDHGVEFALCVRNPSCIPIRPKYMERIFDRWFRSPEAEEEEVQGTGIGLTLARAVVTAHGGHVSVEQEELRDGAYETTFRLWFPSPRASS
jgi:two-component system sensor histidine kinase VicK